MDETVTPYIEKSRELYNVRLKHHVDGAIERARRVYTTYVAPRVAIAKDLVEELTERVVLVASDVFDDLAEHYEKMCLASLGRLREIGHGKAVLDSVLNQVEKTCRNAEESVAVFLKAVFLVFIIVFRRSLWRFFIGTVRLFFRMLWFFSPARLLLPRRSKQSHQGIDADSHRTSSKKKLNGASRRRP
jgi:hypothetical protein